MSDKALFLLEEAIFIYENAPNLEQLALVEFIKNELKRHEAGLKIGFGLDKDKVEAGLKFIDFVEKQSRP